MNSGIARRMGLLIRVLRRRAGLGQGALAERLGVSQATVSRWEGGLMLPEVQTARSLAEILGALALEREALLAVRVNPQAAQSRLEAALGLQLRAGALPYDAEVPYFADIAAGLGELQEARSAPRELLSVPREVYERDHQAYALRVVGDSMLPLIRSGDILIVSPHAPLSEGCIVAAYVEPDGDVVKQYQLRSDGSLLLLPLNPDYPPILAGAGSGREARVWGRVVMQQRDL